jgi:hypothetical protein
LASAGTSYNFRGIAFAPVSVTATTYNLTAAATATRLTEGQSTTITATIANAGTGTADTLNYTGLNASSATGGSISGSTTSGGPLAQGASGNNTGLTFTAGQATGSAVTVTPTVTGATNATIGGNATAGTTGTASITVDKLAEHVSSNAGINPNRSGLGTANVTKAADGNFLPAYLDSLNASKGTVTVNVTGDNNQFPPSQSVLLIDFASVNSGNYASLLSGIESDLTSFGYTFRDRSTAPVGDALNALATGSRDYDLELIFNPAASGSTSYMDFDFSKYTGTTGNVVNLAVVPEPNTILLGVMGSAVMLLNRRRRSAAN